MLKWFCKTIISKEYRYGSGNYFNTDEAVRKSEVISRSLNEG